MHSLANHTLPLCEGCGLRDKKHGICGNTQKSAQSPIQTTWCLFKLVFHSRSWYFFLLHKKNLKSISSLNKTASCNLCIHACMYIEPGYTNTKMLIHSGPNVTIIVHIYTCKNGHYNRKYIYRYSMSSYYKIRVNACLWSEWLVYSWSVRHQGSQ